MELLLGCSKDKELRFKIRGLAREYFGRPLNDGHLADDYHNPENDYDEEKQDDDDDDHNNNAISTMIIPPTERKLWNRGV
jgi:hypothetical protein